MKSTTTTTRNKTFFLFVLVIGILAATVSTSVEAASHVRGFVRRSGNNENGVNGLIATSGGGVDNNRFLKYSKSKEGKGGKMSKEEKSNEEKSNKTENSNKGKKSDNKVDKAEKGGKKASPATANKTSGNKNVPVNKMDTPMTTNCCDPTDVCNGTSVWYCGGDCSVFPSQC